jgi:retron-type reverse transcriptase
MGLSKYVQLRGAASLSDIAELLGFSPSGLSYVLYKQAENEKYLKFKIPKKSGGHREISAPLGPLKAIQRNLATLLNECRAEIALATPRRPLSHGFRESLSIITNAQFHTGRRYVLNVDLADFFPTFNFGRVRGFFMKGSDFLLHERAATVLAQIACYENSLPQGSPCSPVIADMIGHLLDLKLVGLAKRTKSTYTRYADDLTFSTNQKTFPIALAKPGAASSDPWVIGDELQSTIAAAKFKINASKTRIQFRGSRQMVTGLTVNTKVNVSQRYWRSVRSMCRSLYDNGEYYLPGAIAGSPPTMIKSLDPLAGMLSHVHNVKRKSGSYPDKSPDGTVFGQTDFFRFWFYKSFIASQRPVIICEGPTDNVYLRNAVRRLAVYHPVLGALTPEGFKYAVALFSYANEIHKILKLTGGISPLLAFIHGYRKHLAAYKKCNLTQPVIVVVDNDSALSGSVCNALKKHFGVDITHASPAPFFHLTDNLYLVKTPLVGTLSVSCIEDLFDAPTRAMTLGGKAFHTEKKGFDPTKHIGKVPFATKIVSPNSATISWAGFAPLLDRIVAVLGDYAAKVTP